ncbi:MAG: LapA family protein [Tardiphaga sp.]
MRRFLTALVLIPLAIIFIAFAIANRHAVTVSFNPFSSSDPSDAVSLPLFAVIILVAILGVIAGGIATWLRQSHWRRAARAHEADARQARTELAEMRVQAATTARNAAQRLPVPVSAGALAPGMRDNSGATL